MVNSSLCDQIPLIFLYAKIIMENISSLAFVKSVKMVFSVLITDSLHLFISFQKAEKDVVF